ncbi:MAG: transcriptional regulator [Actinobacteria bacterium]|nr:transcriptional regulator [Actinomycetota bacterium]
MNGQPIYLRGALDQDYYHSTIYTPPSGDLLREQVLRAKELGLNCLRCHIKVPDPRYLQWADRLGILVWAELPNWKTLTEDARRRGRETMAGLIRRDFNHPSVVIWTIINEGWGMDLPGGEQHRRWLAETFHWVKDIDPTRLVVDNSACSPNFHIESDLNDFHLYRAIPDQVSEWREWTASWVGAPESTYSSKLEGAGLVKIEKRFVLKKPNTNVALTPVGMERIAHYWDQLERLKSFSERSSVQE